MRAIEGPFNVKDTGGELHIDYKQDSSIHGVEELMLTFNKRKRTLNIDFVKVTEGQRRLGIGRAAVEVLEKIAHNLGAKHITGRASPNTEDFWERLGYQVSPQSPRARDRRAKIYKGLERPETSTGTWKTGGRTRTVKSPPRSRPTTMRGIR